MARTEREGTSRGFVSLADVARLAGASHSAASRAVNGRVGVRPDVREAVLAAAKELGYTPNHNARNLVMKRTGLVALVFYDPDLVVGTTLFSDLVANVVARLDDADYRPALILPGERRLEQLAATIGPETYDGALLIGGRSGDPLLKSLVRRKLPTVVLGRPLDGTEVSYVDLENVSASRMATKHLLDRGRRRLIHIAGPHQAAWGGDRAAGFAAEIAEHPGATGHVRECVFSAAGGYEGARDALEQWPESDGLIVASEALLSGVLRAVAESGRSIPADLALVSFDDGPRLAFANPPITSVRQPLAEMGQAMARVLLDTIDNRSARHTLHYPGELVIRASS
ncbi:MAG: LacI family transcriptional regulator [Actinobacteria bacterium]|nr:LacI family transcriptional regulator [Actinomycetota bacterium]